MAGRPLGAPNAALPVPDEPLARLWHAATVLREHRGDGHIGALVAAGVDGCEALALRVARGQAEGAGPSREQLQPAAGLDRRGVGRGGRTAWPAGAGWTRPGRSPRPGRAAHQAIEDATDVAAARPWARLGAGADRGTGPAADPDGAGLRGRAAVPEPGRPPPPRLL